MDRADRELAADIFACLGHEARLAILEGLHGDRSMTAIASDLGMQRGSLQDHIERVIDCGLVYRPETGDRTYALTPLGRYLLEVVEDEGEIVASVLHRHEELAQQIRESLEDVALSETERERAVTRETWERLADSFDELPEE